VPADFAGDDLENGKPAGAGELGERLFQPRRDVERGGEGAARSTRGWIGRLTRGLTGSSPIAAPSLVALREQIGQPRDVAGDRPRLVLRQHLRLQRLGRVVAAI
jgi:hypothetical protein